MCFGVTKKCGPADHDSGGEQAFDHVHVTVARRQHQGRAAVGRSGIHVGLGAQQHLDALEVAL